MFIGDVGGSANTYDRFFLFSFFFLSFFF